MAIGSLIGKVAQLAKRKRQISKDAKQHSKTKKRVKKELSKTKKTPSKKKQPKEYADADLNEAEYAKKYPAAYKKWKKGGGDNPFGSAY